MNISKLRELEWAATAGPWITGGCSGRMVKPVVFYGGDGFLADADTKEHADLIVATRNALPSLLKVAEAAKSYRDCSMDDIAKFETTYKALCEALAELERA